MLTAKNLNNYTEAIDTSGVYFNPQNLASAQLDHELDSPTLVAL
jgi:hypothetical protein